MLKLTDPTLLRNQLYIDGQWVNADKDRKRTRLNSSHDQLSSSVFCLKKNSQYATKTKAVLLSASVPHTRHCV